MEVKRVSVTFYPYAELKHTWKNRGGNVVFRVSDYLKDAPEEVLTSLAWYLVSRAVGKACPDGHVQKYLSFVRSRDMWMSKKDLYFSRERSLVLEPKGRVRDLRAVFDCVNSFYFSGFFTAPILAWTTGSPRRRLGYYFEAIDLLAVNRVFDSERIPRYALEFVIYHELLHSIIKPESSLKRRTHHTSEFRAREREFSHYEKAITWLRRIAAQG
ncbi:MAG: hypothetical protein ACUVT7_01630 [Thermoplasmata archaeon]